MHSCYHTDMLCVAGKRPPRCRSTVCGLGPPVPVQFNMDSEALVNAMDEAASGKDITTDDFARFLEQVCSQDHVLYTHVQATGAHSRTCIADQQSPWKMACSMLLW